MKKMNENARILSAFENRLVNATIHIAIHTPVVELEGRDLKK